MDAASCSSVFMASVTTGGVEKISIFWSRPNPSRLAVWSAAELTAVKNSASDISSSSSFGYNVEPSPEFDTANSRATVVKGVA